MRAKTTGYSAVRFFLLRFFLKKMKETKFRVFEFDLKRSKSIKDRIWKQTNIRFFGIGSMALNNLKFFLAFYSWLVDIDNMLWF